MQNMRRASLVGLILALASSGLPAGEGRIPIFAAPTTLAAPGRYFVTRNLAIAAGSLITITSDDVDLDLNGFVLSSTAAAPAITATSVNGVTIHNGTIIGGGSNIQIDSGQRIVIEDVHAVGAADWAVLLNDSTQFVVRRVLARSAADCAIYVSNSPAVPSAQGTIADNLIEDCGCGISVSSSNVANPANVAIVNNAVRGNTIATAIIVAWGAGCLIAENTIEDIGGYGMFLQTNRCRISNNVVSRAGSTGLAYGIQQNGSDNLFLNNVVSSGGFDGFLIIGSRNYLEGNLANSNAGFGFRIGGGGGHVYRRNGARGNGGVAGGCGAPPCSPDLCVSPAGAATATSAGDNFLPGPPAFPGCI